MAANMMPHPMANRVESDDDSLSASVLTAGESEANARQEAARMRPSAAALPLHLPSTGRAAAAAAPLAPRALERSHAHVEAVGRRAGGHAYEEAAYEEAQAAYDPTPRSQGSAARRIARRIEGLADDDLDGFLASDDEDVFAIDVDVDGSESGSAGLRISPPLRSLLDTPGVLPGNSDRRAAAAAFLAAAAAAGRTAPAPPPPAATWRSKGSRVDFVEAAADGTPATLD